MPPASKPIVACELAEAIIELKVKRQKHNRKEEVGRVLQDANLQGRPGVAWRSRTVCTASALAREAAVLFCGRAE